MNACVYARTCTREKRHHTTSIPNQTAFCMDLARQRNLRVEPEHVFTDVEMPGNWPPTCWATEDDDSRPALSAMVEAVDAGRVTKVVVRRLEKLGTTSAVLTSLLELFVARGVWIICTREQVEQDEDPSAAFALSILRPCLQFDDDVEGERRERLKAKKLEEIERLAQRIRRLEADVEDLSR